MTETLPEKRYSEIVFQCAACGCLDSSSRKDTTTCSTRCRTWLHRHPEHTADLVARCKSLTIPLALVLQARAIQRLMPQEYSDRIRDGELEVDETRSDVYRAFVALVMDLACNASGETLQAVQS